MRFRTKQKPTVIDMDYETLLKSIMRKHGELFPKKHGEWYRLKMYDNYFLVFDTWNGQIYLHEGAEDSGVDNCYRVVYVFSGIKKTVEYYMMGYWYSYVQHLTLKTD